MLTADTEKEIEDCIEEEGQQALEEIRDIVAEAESH